MTAQARRDGGPPLLRREARIFIRYQSLAALRLFSIIVGAAIGALFFKERFGAPRIAAAGLLVVGIGLMLHAG
jgi:drug/metabolite transporter (DMT)-like permease